MIRITNDIWIGGEHDEAFGILSVFGIEALLNVARDLPRIRPYSAAIAYHHVGLVDGPGNDLALYVAAACTLDSLVRHSKVLVCCHSGSRSLAIVLCHLQMCNPLGWDYWLKALGERLDTPLPPIHEAHRKAFDQIERDHGWTRLKEIIHEE